MSVCSISAENSLCSCYCSRVWQERLSHMKAFKYKRIYLEMYCSIFWKKEKKMMGQQRPQKQWLTHMCTKQTMQQLQLIYHRFVLSRSTKQPLASQLDVQNLPFPLLKCDICLFLMSTTTGWWSPASFSSNTSFLISDYFCPEDSF